MDKHTLKADNRKLIGRKVKNLRKEGILPANIYGKEIKSLSVQINAKDFDKVFANAGETGIIEIQIGETKRPSLVHNIQKDPLSNHPIHVDFLQVNLKEKVAAEVAVELSGESPAEKQGLGTLVQYINEIEVEALPGDLPERFVIDASKLTEVDQSVMIKDLKVDSNKVKIIDSPDTIVVKIEPPQKVEEEIPAVPPEGEEAAVEEGEKGTGETEEKTEQPQEAEPKDGKEEKN